MGGRNPRINGKVERKALEPKKETKGRMDYWSGATNKKKHLKF